MIEVPVKAIPELVKKAYELSKPIGMGFMHFREGGLSDEEVKNLIDWDDKTPVRMDYVLGRCCKFNIYKKGDKFEMRDTWYDHSDSDQDQMLEIVLKHL